MWPDAGPIGATRPVQRPRRRGRQRGDTLAWPWISAAPPAPQGKKDYGRHLWLRPHEQTLLRRSIPDARSAPHALGELKLGVGVNIDYHLTYDQRFYSVPCELINGKVDVRATVTVVEVWNDGGRVTSHERSYGRIRLDPLHAEGDVAYAVRPALDAPAPAQGSAQRLGARPRRWRPPRSSL
ncbi:Mu transposase domain-containing protein [Sorangium sp. So ce233]|uniref:Mu transposase domain-containing protein n=1 Tax=Sorangium sp. So ce233 TaxID=3133290 RepID=UPI003F5F294B